MKRAGWIGIAVAGGALAAGALALQWMQYLYLARLHSLEVYLGLVAAGFMALGVWMGARLFRPRRAGEAFTRNALAIASLGISDREFEVLELIANGRSNKEIAARLGVSPNTIKTHVARLYEKLEVSRRIQAVQKARDLGLIP